MFASFGLEVNFNAGKTEVIFSVAGPGARAAKRDLFVDHNAVIDVHTQFGARQLRIVTAYKHLGVLISCDRSMRAEAVHRTTALTDAFAPLHRPIFADKSVTSHLKVALTGTLLWTRLLHLAGTWHALPATALRTINGAYMRPLRRAVGVRYHDGEPTIRDATVLDQTESLPLLEVLRLARLHWLPRLLRSAPRYLLVMLDCEARWRAQVIDDMHWIHQVGFDEYLPDPRTHSAPWLELARAHPRAWKRGLARTRTKLVHQHHQDHLAMPAPTTGTNVNRAWVCYACGGCFGSRRALAGHAARCDGYVSPAWDVIHDTTCPACLRQFWTVSRIREHYTKGSPRCAQLVARHLDAPSPLVREELLKVSGQQRTHRRSSRHQVHDGNRPAVRCSGPLPRWA